MTAKTDTASWPDQAVLDGRTVRVLALKSENNVSPFFFSPVEDTNQRVVLLGSELTGDEPGELIARKKKIFEAAKHLLVLPGDDYNQIPIKHNDKFNLANDREAAIFYLLNLHGSVIAPQKSSVNPLSHRYFFEDRQRDVKNTRDNTKLKRKAFELISKIPLEDASAVVRLVCEFNPKGFNEDMIFGELEDKADKDPAGFLRVMEDDFLGTKLLIAKLLNAGVMIHDRQSGVYRVGQQKLGVGLLEAVDFLNKEENTLLKDSWAKQVIVSKGKMPKIEAEKKEQEKLAKAT